MAFPKLEAHLKGIAERMKSGEVAVGFMEGSTYPDGTPVAAVAFWNEYGHGGNFPAPPRPFFRIMIAKEKPTWAGKMADLAKQSGDKEVLESMGVDISAALKESINEFDGRELSKTTLMLRKMFGNSHSGIKASDVLKAQRLVAEGKQGAIGTQAHPLIWTGEMRESVTYKVKE